MSDTKMWGLIAAFSLVGFQALFLQGTMFLGRSDRPKAATVCFGASALCALGFIVAGLVATHVQMR